MKKNHKTKDDNHIIVPMNVDGMPWYTNKKHIPASRDEHIQFTKKERRVLVFSALAMALLVGIVFVVIFFLVFLGLDLLWLR